MSIHGPQPRAIAESTKHSKREMLISTKLHAFVEYEAVEAAEKAVSIRASMDRENKLGRDLILRRTTLPVTLSKQEMRRIIPLMGIMKIHLMKRMGSICQRIKVGRGAEIDGGQENTIIVAPMDWAMEVLLLLEPLKCQSDLLDQKCLMELGDSQWDAVGLLSPVQINRGFWV